MIPAPVGRANRSRRASGKPEGVALERTLPPAKEPKRIEPKHTAERVKHDRLLQN